MRNLTQSIPISERIAVLAHFLDRYITIVAITVAVIGVASMALGPVRSLLTQQSPSPSAVSSGAGQVNMGITDSSSLAIALDPFSRQFEPFTTIPDRPRRDVVGYTIKAGDTLFGIAGLFGLKPETLFWSNRETLLDDVHLIKPGINLSILPVDGVYYKSDGEHNIDWIAQKYQVDPLAIINSQYNDLQGASPSDVPDWGRQIVVPGGTSDFLPQQPAIVQTTDTRTGRVVTSFMGGMPGSCSAGIGGGGGTGAWIPPVSPGSYTVTQGYAPWHSGLDLASVVGTSVHAADTGVVVFSGWNIYGYGNLVVLDHGNGWTTYYAHLNSISVGCGQTVGRGSGLGTVGTTGNSTGPHLHFEMRWQHNPDNPAGYVGF
jgi:hypothetical protein